MSLMKYELKQKIYYMQDNRVHCPPVLGRSFVEFIEDIAKKNTTVMGDEGVYYQTCHGIIAEKFCFATREELLQSL